MSIRERHACRGNATKDLRTVPEKCKLITVLAAALEEGQVTWSSAGWQAELLAGAGVLGGCPRKGLRPLCASPKWVEVSRCCWHQESTSRKECVPSHVSADVSGGLC